MQKIVIKVPIMIFHNFEIKSYNWQHFIISKKVLKKLWHRCDSYNQLSVNFSTDKIELIIKNVCLSWEAEIMTKCHKKLFNSLIKNVRLFMKLIIGCLSYTFDFSCHNHDLYFTILTSLLSKAFYLIHSTFYLIMTYDITKLMKLLNNWH